jgi:glycolate oxidase
MKYSPVDKQTIEELISIAGERNVITEREKLAAYSHDETPVEQFGHMPEVVVKPGSGTEVSEIVKLANRLHIPVTPRGAGSGLSGGAIPVYGGIVVSLERMNRIIEIDRDNMMMTLEPGVITNEVNEKIAFEGLFFAGYPMSIETCFIGGNVAENAGGGKAIKYGVTGRYVVGLEVVLPTGEIVCLGGKRVKDVTGYDLKQLIIGSEGTLGIITKVIIKLLPLPGMRIDLLVLFDGVKSAIDMVPEIMTGLKIVPTSIEFMDELSFSTACTYLNEKLPYGDAGAMLLIEVDGNREEQLEAEAETIGELCLDRGAIEVYVADNHTTQERVWAIRRSIAEAFIVYSPHQSLEDIVVPTAAIPLLMPHLQRISEKYGIQIPCYGHAGDGNLHATLVKNPETTLEEWYGTERKALEELYDVIAELGGTISGEHGIGSKRREYFRETSDPALLELMRRIKRAFDPNNIMNPGKIFDVEPDNG